MLNILPRGVGSEISNKPELPPLMEQIRWAGYCCGTAAHGSRGKRQTFKKNRLTAPGRGFD